MSEFDAIAVQNSTENEKLSNQCANLIKQISLVEREARSRENRIKEEHGIQLAELSSKLREDYRYQNFNNLK